MKFSVSMFGSCPDGSRFFRVISGSGFWFTFIRRNSGYRLTVQESSFSDTIAAMVAQHFYPAVLDTAWTKAGGPRSLLHLLLFGVLPKILVYG